MRVCIWLVAGTLALLGVHNAVADTASTPSTSLAGAPRWVRTCMTELKAGASSLTRRDPRIANAVVERRLSMTEEAPSKCPPLVSFDRVQLSVSSPSVGGLFVDLDIGPAVVARGYAAKPWTELVSHDGGTPGSHPPVPPWPDSIQWSRSLPGRVANVSVNRTDGSPATARFIERMKRAADVCIAAAPAYSLAPAPRDEPRASCSVSPPTTFAR